MVLRWLAVYSYKKDIFGLNISPVVTTSTVTFWGFRPVLQFPLLSKDVCYLDED